MIEGHTFVDAYFTDNEKRNLETIWQEKDTEIQRPFVIDVIEDPDIFKQFLDMEIQVDGYKITEQWLYERTWEWIKSQRKVYENAIKQIAINNGEWEEIFAETVNYDLLLDWIDKRSKYDTSNKEVFKIKLKMFEQPHVLESTDRELKAKLRKAQTLKEILTHYLQFEN